MQKHKDNETTSTKRTILPHRAGVDLTNADTVNLPILDHHSNISFVFAPHFRVRDKDKAAKFNPASLLRFAKISNATNLYYTTYCI